jgi:phytoene dehydrogenase-like protein
MQNNAECATTVSIIGGGLAGLTAATYLARAGRRVTVFERAASLGGRARSHDYSGFRFNQGPHALYAGGAGVRVLRELGIPFSGGKPALAGLGVRGTDLAPLPTGLNTFLQSPFLSGRGKLELLRFMAELPFKQTQRFDGISFQQWAEARFQDAGVRDLLETLARVTAYTNAPEVYSAGAFLAQLWLAFKSNVWYLDGGWQRLLEHLIQTAQAAGVEIVISKKVVNVRRTDAGWQVACADGSFQLAASIIIAADPATASALVEDGAHSALRAWNDAAIPVRAASLNLGLRRLPQPARKVAFGIGQPLYFSTHSAYAKDLAPTGQVMAHAMKYLPPAADNDPEQDLRELEALVDRVQPGWRAEVVERRFLPALTVTPWLVTAARGGLAGRPGPAVPGLPDLYVAGDWVGATGMLADASFASARLAAQMVLTSPTAMAHAAVNEDSSGNKQAEMPALR